MEKLKILNNGTANTNKISSNNSVTNNEFLPIIDKKLDIIKCSKNGTISETEGNGLIEDCNEVLKYNFYQKDKKFFRNYYVQHNQTHNNIEKSTNTTNEITDALQQRNITSSNSSTLTNTAINLIDALKQNTTTNATSN